MPPKIELSGPEALRPSAAPVDSFLAPNVIRPAQTNSLLQISEALEAALPGVEAGAKKFTQKEIKRAEAEGFRRGTLKDLEAAIQRGEIPEAETRIFKIGLDRARARLAAKDFSERGLVHLSNNRDRINAKDAPASVVNDLIGEFRSTFLNEFDPQESAGLLANLTPHIDAAESNLLNRFVNERLANMSTELRESSREGFNDILSRGARGLPGVKPKNRGVIQNDIANQLKLAADELGTSIGNNREANAILVDEMSNWVLANEQTLETSGISIDEVTTGLLKRFKTGDGFNLADSHKFELNELKNEVYNRRVQRQSQKLSSLRTERELGFQQDISPKLAEIFNSELDGNGFNNEAFEQLITESNNRFGAGAGLQLLTMKRQWQEGRRTTTDDQEVATSLMAALETTSNKHEFIGLVMNEIGAGTIKKESYNFYDSLFDRYNERGIQGARDSITSSRGSLFRLFGAGPGGTLERIFNANKRQAAESAFAEANDFLTTLYRNEKLSMTEVANEFRAKITEISLRTQFDPVTGKQVRPVIPPPPVGEFTMANQLTDEERDTVYGQAGFLKQTSAEGDIVYQVPLPSESTLKSTSSTDPNQQPRFMLETAGGVTVDVGGGRGVEFRTVFGGLGPGTGDKGQIAAWRSFILSGSPDAAPSQEQYIQNQTDKLSKQISMWHKLEPENRNELDLAGLEAARNRAERYNPRAEWEAIEQAIRGTEGAADFLRTPLDVERDPQGQILGATTLKNQPARALIMDQRVRDLKELQSLLVLRFPVTFGIRSTSEDAILNPRGPDFLKSSIPFATGVALAGAIQEWDNPETRKQGRIFQIMEANGIPNRSRASIIRVWKEEYKDQMQPFTLANRSLRSTTVSRPPVVNTPEEE